MDADEFTESRRVIVTHSLGVTESLKHRVSLDDLIFQVALFERKVMSQCLQGFVLQVRTIGRVSDKKEAVSGTISDQSHTHGRAANGERG